MILKTNNRKNQTVRNTTSEKMYDLVEHRGKNARKGSRGGLYLIIKKGWTLTAKSRKALSDLQWEDWNGRLQWLNVRFAPGLTYQDKEYAWWGSLGPASILGEEARKQIMSLVEIEPTNNKAGTKHSITETTRTGRASITINGITYYAETPTEPKEKLEPAPATKGQKTKTRHVAEDTEVEQNETPAHIKTYVL